MGSAIISGIIALIATGASAGASASATKKAQKRADQLADRQAGIQEEDRQFTLKNAREDIKLAEQEFAHQKDLNKKTMAFTKQDVDRQARDTRNQLNDSFSSNVLKLGAEDTLGNRERDNLRLESM